MEIKSISDAVNQICGIRTAKKPDRVDAVVGNVTGFLLRLLPDKGLKDLLFVSTLEFDEDNNPREIEPLLRAMIAEIVFDKPPKRYFVRRSDVTRAGYGNAQTLNPAVKTINHFLGKILEIDFSDCREYELTGCIYFSIRKKMKLAA